MSSENLQKLVKRAGEMALRNIWGENAYKINMAILKADQNNCAAYTRLAKYYRLNDNISEAKNMYLKTLDIDPNNRGALNNLDDIEKDQRDNDAVEKIKTTVELLKEGQKSMVKGRYRIAEKLFVKAYSIEPLLLNAVSLAGVYKKMGKYERIEKLYNQLITDNNKKSDLEAIDNEFKNLRLNLESIAE
jgi:tetratricopeptide (TPR) repeat protein